MRVIIEDMENEEVLVFKAIPDVGQGRFDQGESQKSIGGSGRMPMTDRPTGLAADPVPTAAAPTGGGSGSSDSNSGETTS